MRFTLACLPVATGWRDQATGAAGATIATEPANATGATSTLGRRSRQEPQVQPEEQVQQVLPGEKNVGLKTCLSGAFVEP